MPTKEPEHYLRSIEKIVDDFVLEFEMVGLILLDRKGRIITTRNISDLFDVSKFSKMVTKLFPKTKAIEEFYPRDSFSWLIFQGESQSLLVYQVNDQVVLGMLVKNEISLNFYKQQIVDLTYRLKVNFDNLYESLNKGTRE